MAVSWPLTASAQQTERVAWKQLSSALEDLDSANFDSQATLSMGLHFTDQQRYNRILNRLSSWKATYRGVGKPYWHKLAKSGEMLSYAMVEYGKSGDEKWLYLIEDEDRRMHSLIARNCKSPDYMLDVVKYCS